MEWPCRAWMCQWNHCGSSPDHFGHWASALSNSIGVAKLSHRIWYKYMLSIPRRPPIYRGRAASEGCFCSPQSPENRTGYPSKPDTNAYSFSDSFLSLLGTARKALPKSSPTSVLPQSVTAMSQAENRSTAKPSDTSSTAISPSVPAIRSDSSFHTKLQTPQQELYRHAMSA